MENREKALKLAREGFRIIPLEPGMDRPLSGFKWKEFQGRAMTNWEIEKVWGEYPAAGIGIVTGYAANLVVICVKPEAATFARDRLHYTPMKSLHANGDIHHFYRHPKNQAVPLMNRARGQKIAVRGDGGYVVAGDIVWEKNEAIPVFIHGDL